MARLDEIIIGTCVSNSEMFVLAKENYVSSEMFEDRQLADIFNALAKAYENGNYSKDFSVFNILSLCENNNIDILRVIECAGDADFKILRWEYNRDCFFTGKGNWTDMTFVDYIKEFVKQYVERCKEKRMRRSYQ